MSDRARPGPSVLAGLMLAGAAAVLAAGGTLAQSVTLVAEDLLQAPATAGSAPLARLNVLREAPDGSGRLFVNDMRGPLYLLSGGGLQTYLDLSVEFTALKSSPGLGLGFVSFAFDPEFSTSGLFYTAHTEFVGAVPPNLGPAIATTIVHHAVVVEWAASDPAAAAFSGTRRELMRIAAPHRFHNVGEIAFNPYATPGESDYRLLYIGQGDYGSVEIGEPEQLQRLDTVWGAVLRIDPLDGPFQRGGTTYDYGIPPDNPFVDGDPATLDEIFAYGVRNTHRLAWDPATGDLYGSDIGQGNFEEINRLHPGGNYGWPVREGIMALDPQIDEETVFALPPDDALLGYSYPVAFYDHGTGNAIAGGFPYRGSGILGLAGKFVFGDVVTGDLFHADLAALIAADDGDPATVATVTATGLVHGGQPTTLLQVVRDALGDPSVSRTDLRFGLDAGGELWITTKQDGHVRRLVASDGAGPGRTPNTLRLAKPSATQLRLQWNAPACSGWTDFAVYEGPVGDWTGHQSLTCSDAGSDRREIVTPSAGNRYYLVVPLDAASEGSFGVDSTGAERVAPAAGRCRPAQVLTCL